MGEPIPLPGRVTIEESVEDYLAECRARGLRVATVNDAYGWPLRRLWVPWCREHDVVDVAQVTQAVVNRFTADVRDRRRSNGELLSPHSVRSYGVVVSRWLSWAHREGLMEARAKVPRGRVSRPVREVITPEEHARMVELARVDRDRLILQILWETGMRASELLRLRTTDLIRHDGRWFLRILSAHRGGGAKDSRERFAPLPHARDLRRFIDGPRSRMPAATDHIWLSRRKGPEGLYAPLSISGLEQMIHDVGQDAGLSHRAHPHLYRHSAITHWLRQGVDPLRIASIVGHSSLAMIHQHYSQLDHRDAYDALAEVLAKEKR